MTTGFFKMSATDSLSLSAIDELLEEARAGRMFIVADARSGQDDGLLVMAGQFVTPDAVTFMTKFGGGLICVAMTAERIRALDIPSMASRDGTSPDTGHPASIEARLGVTTGISAADRAHTVLVAIDPSSTREDIVSPGHVFPCVAKAGGVLVRAGYAEASVDIARLAGLDPSAVVCKVLTEDGEVARLPDLLALAREQGLKVGSVSDLIAYRRRTEKLIERVSSETLQSVHGGEWTVHHYRDRVDGDESLALVKGEIGTGKTLVRVHALSVLDDVLGRSGGRAELVPAAMKAIAEAGSGVLVLLQRSMGQEFLLNDALYGAERGQREYGVGAQILIDLGVSEIELLRNGSPEALVGLEGFGLSIVGRRPL